MSDKKMMISTMIEAQLYAMLMMPTRYMLIRQTQRKSSRSKSSCFEFVMLSRQVSFSRWAQKVVASYPP
jgi:hypothetical protein